MDMFKTAIDYLMSFSLFINALLFLPQVFRIYRTKSVDGLSLITFLGFSFIQLLFFLHGLVLHDWYFMTGIAPNFLVFGAATIGILIYRKRSAYVISR